MNINEPNEVYLEVADMRHENFACVGHMTWRGHRHVVARSVCNEERTFTGHDADDEARSWLAAKAEQARPGAAYLLN